MLRSAALVAALVLSLASSSEPPQQRQQQPYYPPPAQGSDPSLPPHQPQAQPGFGSAPAGNDALQFCVDETNRLRAQHGKPPVARSPQLEAYAAEGAREDHQSGQAHAHFSRTGGGGFSFAENECPAWNLESDVPGVMRSCFAMMMDEGPPPAGSYNHYSNMLGDHGSVGCGIYTAGDGTVTIVQDFGE